MVIKCGILIPVNFIGFFINNNSELTIINPQNCPRTDQYNYFVTLDNTVNDILDYRGIFNELGMGQIKQIEVTYDLNQKAEVNMLRVFNLMGNIVSYDYIADKGSRVHKSLLTYSNTTNELSKEEQSCMAYLAKGLQGLNYND